MTTQARRKVHAKRVTARRARQVPQWLQSGTGPLYEPAPAVRDARLRGEVLVCELARGDTVRASLAELGAPRRPKVVGARPSTELESVVELLRSDGTTLEVGTDHLLHVRSPGYDPATAGAAREELRHRIASRLRHRRAMLGLTADFVASRAGLRRPNYARMESGRHLHQLDVLDRVARALRADLADFVSRAPPPWETTGRAPRPAA
jgi:DNA-binding XRE family transcriptional regulator